MFSVTFYFDCECGLKRQNSFVIRCLFFFFVCWLLVFFWLSFTLIFHYMKWALELYGLTLILPRYIIVAGHNGFTLVVRKSVRPSVFSFADDNLVNFNGFSSNDVGINIIESWSGIVKGQGWSVIMQSLQCFYIQPLGLGDTIDVVESTIFSHELVEYVVFKLWMPTFQRISFHVILRLQELCLCCLVARKSIHVYYTFLAVKLVINYPQNVCRNIGQALHS